MLPSIAWTTGSLPGSSVHQELRTGIYNQSVCELLVNIQSIADSIHSRLGASEHCYHLPPSLAPDGFIDLVRDLVGQLELSSLES